LALSASLFTLDVLRGSANVAAGKAISSETVSADLRADREKLQKELLLPGDTFG
jgi:hypothetical protein